MTLGNAAAARVRLIEWCRECRHQLKPDPAEMARRYGPERPVPEWRSRLVCLHRGVQLLGVDGESGGDYQCDRRQAATISPLMSGG